MNRSCVFLATVLCASQASAITVTNGSMDHNLPPGSYNSFGGFPPSGWTALPMRTPDIVDSQSMMLDMSWVSSTDGGTFVHSVAQGTIFEGIFQSISGLTIGQQYAVNFEQSITYSTQTAFGDPGFWDVIFGGATLASAAMTPPTTQTPFGWQNQSLIFTATATTQDLTFRANFVGQSAPRVSLGIDGVSIGTVVPAPPAVWLLGTALLGLAARARKMSARR